VRIYESKAKALASHSKPIIAVPLNAVKAIQKLMFDLNDDQRLH